MLVRASSRRKGHNYITLMNAWFEGPARKRLTLAARDIFQCLLHVTNAKYFPESIEVYEADLAEFIEKRKVRDEAETAYYKQRNELLTEAAQVVADWESKRKKLWIETRTVPVMSMGRK